MLALAAAFCPTAAAHRHVAVVATDFYLVTVHHHVALAVDARIDDGLAAARTGRLHLVDGVGNLKEPAGTVEKMTLEVGAQAVAHDVDSEIVDNAGQLVHLVGMEKLRLVDEYPFLQPFGFEYFRQVLIHVGFRINPFTPPFDADARADDAVLLSVVDDGFHAEILHAALFEIVGGGEEHGRFGRAHGSVAEI